MSKNYSFHLFLVIYVKTVTFSENININHYADSLIESEMKTVT